MRIERIVLAFLLLITACNDGNDPPYFNEPLLLNLNVGTEYVTDLTDNWIVIHDVNGELLEYKAFEAGDQTTITTTRSPSGRLLMVTLLQYGSGGDATSYNVQTYTNIEKGSTINLRGEVPSYLTQTGTFKVKVTDVSAEEEFILSSKHSIEQPDSFEGNSLTITGAAITEANKFILQASSDKGSKYKYIENVTAGEAFEVSYNDMSPFDKLINIAIPDCNNGIVRVWGTDEIQGPSTNSYLLFHHIFNHEHTNFRLGYLNDLNFYWTNLLLFYPGYQLFYYKHGFIPDTNITWPNAADYSFSNKTIDNFQAQANGPMLWRASTFEYRSESEPFQYVRWVVNSPDVMQTIKEMPKEIIDAHPLLQFDNVKHDQTIFYSSGQPYRDYVQDMFSGGNAFAERIGIGLK